MHGQFTPAVSLGEISSVNKQSLRSCKIWRVAYTLYFTDNCTVNADYNYAHRSEYAFVRTILADETKKKITGKLFVNEANKQNKTKLLRAACYRWKRNSHGGGNRVSGAIARLSSS